ncbi:hypothetical protein D3P07_14080 [Paenibacillus sp. 1011MAR3C5]|uniref:hypothetical protein n=1 Tax=Paenibacillus sp. 1011MAR3C5 TaxID=1675787 RepID=UPI000E6D4887|nr:hypothetical protein [Paenibacillus sp. 1011MAR3C5]RJE87461.1 hypothetical protein D3P07_14080 [Paenibacillus sp. 1011MAR3C5]
MEDFLNGRSNKFIRHLQFQDVNQLRLLEQIKALLLGKASNPIAAIERFIKKEAGAGKKVEVNPHALTYDRYELSKDVREEILESAIMLLS